MKALDFSYAVPSAAWWRARKEEGNELAIADAWTGTHIPGDPEISLNRARAAGMAVEAYAVVNLHPGAYTIDKAREACGSAWPHVRTVWVDVEVTGIDTTTMIAHTREALARARALGKRTGIYTGRWFWVGHMRNTSAFAGEWLWNAHYDLNADIDYFTTPYGGFTRLAIEQYKGTTSVDGQSVDLNTMTAAYIKEVADVAEAADITLRQLSNYATRLAAGKFPAEWGASSWAAVNLQAAIWYLVEMIERRDDRLDVLFAGKNTIGWGTDRKTVGEWWTIHRTAIKALQDAGARLAAADVTLAAQVRAQAGAIEAYQTQLLDHEARLAALEASGGVPAHPHEFEVIARTAGG
jgi:hypothetical protein